MDKYKQLIVIFSDTLKKSKDYHIAYLHGIGYASVIGVYQKGNKMNSSMQIDVIFGSPQEMAARINSPFLITIATINTPTICFNLTRTIILE